MKYISIGLDSNFQVIPKESSVVEYNKVFETEAEAVYEPIEGRSYRGLQILDKIAVKKGDHQFRPLMDSLQISDYSEDKFWRKYYSYRLYIFTEKPKEEIEKYMTKEFTKWVNKKLAKYNVKTKIDIKITGEWV